MGEAGRSYLLIAPFSQLNKKPESSREKARVDLTRVGVLLGECNERWLRALVEGVCKGTQITVAHGI